MPKPFLYRAMRLVVFIFIAAVLLESISSYALYRYYSAGLKTLAPTGLATVNLVKRIIIKAKGEHPMVEVSIDHGPLFHADETLGYVINPGNYLVTERLDNQSHAFRLSIGAQGNRATSYVPVRASHRIIVAGDSAMFGWGLDDEFTMPWLLQTRLPDFEVVNVSVTSYSTVQAMLRLDKMEPKVGDDDIVILQYHPVTTEFNVAADPILHAIDIGYELQLGDPKSMPGTRMPYGVVDSQGGLSLKSVPLDCWKHMATEACVRRTDKETAVRVTELAIDEILALKPGHLVLAFTNGSDTDPVIRSAAAKGVIIVDARVNPGDPDSDDSLADSHAGPFWHHRLYSRLVETLQRNHLVD